MPELVIRIKKKADGTAALSCERSDGSVTWQRQEGNQGRFFPLHDLTHYAVETELGHRRGFYGLVAEGWDLTDFGAPWPRGPIPDDADPSEVIVGFLDAERASGAEWSADEFNARLRDYCRTQRIAERWTISEAELHRIRERTQALFARWSAVPPGDILELRFGAE